MLSRFRTVATRVAPRVVAAPVAIQQRMMTDRFKKEESAAERDFINRQERELLKSLLKRVGGADAHKASDDALATVLAKHKVNVPGLAEDLKAWKDSH